MKYIIIFLILSIPIGVFASDSIDAPVNKFIGFDFKGKIINPKCVNLLQTWASESPEFPIITRSIIIDGCQDSNLAFEGKEFKIQENGTVSYYENPNDVRSNFGYRVLGRSLNNIFILFHSGYLGLYRLDDRNITFDFSKQQKRKVTILTKISESWLPCFNSLEVKGNIVTIKKATFDSTAPRSSQCTEVEEILTYDLSEL